MYLLLLLDIRYFILMLGKYLISIGMHTCFERILSAAQYPLKSFGDGANILKCKCVVLFQQVFLLVSDEIDIFLII